MNTLLIYFAFPIAVIIFSILLQKIIKSPILVSAIIFAIFIVITFAAFDETFLIATLAYSILSFITSLLISRLCSNKCSNNTNEILEDILDLLQNSTIVSGESEDSIDQNLGCTIRKRYRKF